MRRSAAVAGIIVVASLVVVGNAQRTATDPSAAARERLRADGLSQPVEIVRDRWGINHIYAKTQTDLFFAQGYAAARDRLFQLEMWRRRATGTTAEIFGRRELPRDIGARLHMFRGNLKDELRHYHPDGEAIVGAFVSGINSYIAETEREASHLPLEFKILGITPGRWTPEVVISRHQALVGNLQREISTAQAIRVVGVDKVRDLSYFQGGEPKLEPDPAIKLALVDNRILELYSAFRGSLEFTRDDIAAEYRTSIVRDQGPGDRDQISNNRPRVLPDPRGFYGPRSLIPDPDLPVNPLDIGSNNWVVGGARTQSGFPMMMNDPHRAQEVPSLRYWVHLVAPGWNVIGGGEPVLPGVSIGHNEHGAWGLTVFGTDSEDLYVYETNPANPNQYRYRGAWEEMRVVTEAIPVQNEAPAKVELKYTRHGPVLREDKANHVAYALRAAWLDIGGAPYLASLRMDQARSWDEFRDACSYSRIPAENMVWADRDGNIGHQAVGVSPIRTTWSGLVPVPGDGRYEWDGLLPIKALPHTANPPQGFLATANNYTVTPGYPYLNAVPYTWADPFRASRISEVLGSGRLFSVAEMVRLQNDELSVPARALVPLLRDVTIGDAAARKARDTLLGWNFVLDRDSVAAGIYEMWQRRVVANVRDTMVPRDARPFITLSMKKTIDWLEAPDGRFNGPFDDAQGRSSATEARDELLVRSLVEAVGELTKRFGGDDSQWRYGHYHHALIEHWLGAVVREDLRARLNVGPLPRGGDAYTINATGGGDNQRSGGSFKIITDTEDWDNAVGLNNPGQSGDPDDPHYRDLFELWARGKYFPIFYSRPKVDSVAERVTTLSPVAASSAGPR
ncbi:MAG: penicillin acylase family protein [Acidobacteria bacterium]|nr:penicillin acylase family protein [Acidobacteriota bacterium]